MSIDSILDRLLAEAGGALAAGLVDDSGEVIETASSGLEGELMRTVGALAQIQLRQLAELVTGGRSENGSMLVECEAMNVSARRLRGGFVLVVVSRDTALAAKGGIALRRAGDALAQELRT